jgi:hypothetical protein
MLTHVLSLAISLLPQAAGKPELQSGTFLYRTCQATIRGMDGVSRHLSVSDRIQELADTNYCQGYVDGFTKGMIFGGFPICFKENPSVGTLVSVYVAYMQKHPASLDEENYAGLAKALIDAYPCSVTK